MTNDVSRPWWLTRPFALILALTLGVYFLRVSLLPVFGEECRRAMIAREMLETGEWVVPRIQGVAQLSRPPLQNWMIAGVGRLTGAVDVWAVRLPSLVATLATVVLIYGSAARCAGAPVAVLAATAYVTMYEVMEYGRLGETEAVFTLFVAGSLLIWHWGDAERWNPWLTWSLGYLLAAGGMMTKGLQAPLYFGGAVAIYLLVLRRWRDLISLPHLGGIGVFVAVVGAWQIAFVRQLGWESGLMIYALNVKYRFTDKTNDSFLMHLLSFPFEVYAVMLPGSLLLIPAAFSSVRTKLAEHRATVLFLAISVLWAFLFVWFPPGARARYYMPLMPLLALLMGLIGQAWLSVPWRNWSPDLRRRLTLGVGLVAAAVFMGPVLSTQARMCDDVEGQVAQLKSKLPAAANLVSLETMHHGFLYHYQKPIGIVPRPTNVEDVPEDLRYFAIHTHNSDPPPLPFEWKEIDVITCDRYRRDVPRVKIHIGKRIDPQLTLDEEQVIRH